MAAPDRSWAGIHRHLQDLPSALSVMLAPSSPSRATTVITDAADRFAPMLSALDGVVAFADCGRLTKRSGWIDTADLVVVLVRQAASAGATVTRIDRTVELTRSLSPRNHVGVGVGVVVIGQRPYPPADIAATVDLPLLGVLPDDVPGAALAAGAWTIGKGANRTPLARSARQLSATIHARLDDGPLASVAYAESPNGVNA